MGESDPRKESGREPRRGFKSFAEAFASLTPAEHVNRFVIPHFVPGAVFWVPDTEAAFGHDAAHPWVLLENYDPARGSVLAAPRTSSRIGEDPANEFFIPAGVLPELDRDGSVLLGNRRRLFASRFVQQGYRYVGCLPESWRSDLLRAHQEVVARARRSMQGR
ncbi:MAG: hypothetical protein EPO26_12690 [Chloroflexota bacterium]|nr:MAG: hypothetical protein EPO26_12690 [Chloroflexota bacterium]